MIITAVLNFFYAIVGGALGLLPEYDVASRLPDTTPFGTALARADAYVPLVAPLSLMVDVLQLAAIFIPVALFVWVWKLIPGKMT